MKTLVLDFETFFSNDFTLKSLTTEAYIRDPQFEAHCLGVYNPETGIKTWMPQEQIPAFIASVDWTQTAVLAHHAHFDGLIFSHHYGMKPAFWFDTLCMARAIHGNHISVSLANLLKIYGVPEKTVPYDAFKGRRWMNIEPGLRAELGAGAADDCAKTWAIFQKMLPGFPKEELRIIDMTVRMFTEPKLVGDVEELQRIQADEWTRKEELVQQLGISKADLNSADKFAALLESLGVEVEYKTTPTGNLIPAIAKTDPFMKELENDADPTVAALATARLEIRSTIDQTRAGRIAGMAARGRLPVYLQYYGAHTSRWSGGDKVNLQNLRRGGDIRKAISAPEGFLIFEPDFSQIEARILLWLAGQFDQLDAFRQGRDLYSEMASEFYGFPVTKAMPAERGTGKQLILSCLGPDTLVLTDSGTKPITAVALNDQLWDGVQWVTHQGLLQRGVHTVIEPVAGLFLTPDHLILCGSIFQEAQNLLNERCLSQALASGSENLPSQDTALLCEEGLKQLWSSVPVALRSTLSTPIIWLKEQAQDAMPALKKLRATGLKSTTAMRTLSLTTHTGVVYLGGLPLLSTAPQTQKTSILNTMGVEALAASGQKIDAVFWHMWLLFREFLILHWNWTAQIIVKGTSQAIYALLRTITTRKTAVPWSNSKLSLPTYDLAYAGPRNRYTIVTSAGPLIVHNCGFGAGDKTIQMTAARGTYGPPVHISLEDAGRAKMTYRKKMYRVAAMWNEADWFLGKIVENASLDWGPMKLHGKRLWLPNGLSINYETLEFRDGEFRMMKRKGWTKMYGAKLVENAVQGLARVVASQAMLRLQALGYPAVNTTHDSSMVLLPDDAHASETAERLLVEMVKPPTWMPDIPLAAEGKPSKRHEK
jgi:hypothetical protein